MRVWKNLWDDESGAVATEYVILVGLIAIALIAVLALFRQQLHDLVLSFANRLRGEDSKGPEGAVSETSSDFGGGTGGSAK